MALAADCMPKGDDTPQLSSACLAEGGYFYLYGLFPEKRLAPLSRPLALARIARRKTSRFAAARLGVLDAWQIRRKLVAAPESMMALFADAAPEMTIGRVSGIDGLVATYTSLGMSREIRLRVAPRPKGLGAKRWWLIAAPKMGKSY